MSLLYLLIYLKGIMYEWNVKKERESISWVHKKSKSVDPNNDIEVFLVLEGP